MTINSLYAPFHSYFRSKRIRELAEALSTHDLGSVLDVGGSLHFYELIISNRMHCRSYTIVNLHLPEEALKPCVRWVVSNALKLPYRDKAFDFVICNSVIEHMGDYESQQALAAELRRVGKGYYVQTPNFWFPVEPHFLTCFLHWLPKRLLAKLVRWCSVWGLVMKPNRSSIDSVLKEIKLLRKGQMADLFPDAKLGVERCFGLAKSFVAIKPR